MSKAASLHELLLQAAVAEVSTILLETDWNNFEYEI